MQIPGVAWVVALTALPLLAVWLNEYFPNALWAAPVAALLVIVAKTIQVVKPPPAPPPGVMMDSAPRGDDKLARWLLG